MKDFKSQKQSWCGNSVKLLVTASECLNGDVKEESVSVAYTYQLNWNNCSNQQIVSSTRVPIYPVSEDFLHMYPH